MKSPSILRSGPLTLIILVAGAVCPAPAQGKLFIDEGESPGFNPCVTNVRQTDSSDIAFGDLNGNGAIDMVYGGGWIKGWDASKSTWRGFGVAFNNGAGRLVPSRLPPPPNQICYGLSSATELADLDGDGDLDLVASTFAMPLCSNPAGKGVQVWENDGTGRFRISTSLFIPSVPNCWGLALGDVDADGDIDIVAAVPQKPDDLILLNDGKGRFTRSTALSGGLYSAYSLRVGLGDLNRDGRLDIIFATVSLATLWLSGPNGKYTEVILHDLDHPHMADLDGDGWAELVAFEHPPYSPSNRIYKVSTTGKLTLVGTVVVSNAIVSSGDIDLDGDLDLMMGPYVFENRGKFNFVDITKSLVEHPSSRQLTQMWLTRILDIDNDGDMDVVGMGIYDPQSRTCRHDAPVIFRNRRRHLVGPPEVGLGKTLTVTTTADDQHVMILGLALKEASVPFGPFGTLRLDPAQMLVSSQLSFNRVPQPWTMRIPNDSRLLGLKVLFQGLDAPIPTTVSPRFTRLFRVRVVQ